MDPVQVIGAGPAGLAAAIVLARRGRPVVVHEMAQSVGHRLNGDLQGIENWTTPGDVLEELRNLGIEPDFPYTPGHGGRIYGPDLKPMEVYSSEPLFYLVRRGSQEDTLDRALEQQARALGVEIRFASRVEHLQGSAIVAIGPRGADAIAKGIAFQTQMPDQVHTIFDDRLAPKGYAYLLVARGYGTLATVLFQDFRRERKCFERTVDAFERLVPLDMVNPREFGGFGNFDARDSAVSHGKLYLGEAAGFQDALWGFGMRYAIRSGVLAARSLLDNLDYDTLCREELLPLVRASLVNRYFFEHLGNWGYRRFVGWAQAVAVRPFLSRRYAETWLKRLFYPLARRHHVSRARRSACSHENCTCVWCRCEGVVCP